MKTEADGDRDRRRQTDEDRLTLGTSEVVAPLQLTAPQSHHHHHHHQSLNREGRWGTTDDFATSFLHFFPVLHCPLELAELQACPFPNVVFAPLPLSALSSSFFHCALQDGFGQT